MINNEKVRTRKINIILNIPNIKQNFAKDGYFVILLTPWIFQKSLDDFENKIDTFSSKFYTGRHFIGFD